ncbi:MAG: MATE family efflux transporter [Verrucomicrobiota bacterium]
MKPDSDSPALPEPADEPSLASAVPPDAAAASRGLLEEPPTPPGVWNLIKLAAPMVAIQTTHVVMQFTDAFMVKELGADALAAILPAGLVFWIPIAFAYGFLSSINTFVAQCLGKTDFPGCGHYTWQGIILAALYGTAVLALWPLAPAIFAQLGHSAAVQALEVEYFQICLLSGGVFLVLQALSNFYIGIHRPGLLFWFAAGGAILNIGLNYVLIFGHFGFPELGFAGAAWGTVLATAAQCLALLVHFLTGARASAFLTRRVRVEWRAMWEMVRIGFPTGLQILFDLMSWGVALVWLVGWFGTVHLAATTIVVRYMHLSFMPAVGVGQVLQALVGRAIGSGDPETANQHAYTAFRLCIAYMVLMAIGFVLFREQLIDLFVKTGEPDATEIIHIGAGVFIIAGIFQAFDAIGIVFVNALRGAGDTLWPAVVTGVMCVSIFIGGGVLVATYVPALESWGPWLMGMVYIIPLSLVLWARWVWGPWRTISIFDARRSQPETA